MDALSSDPGSSARTGDVRVSPRAAGLPGPAAWLPIAFITAVLIALVVIPIVVEKGQRALANEIQTLILPARDRMAGLRSALIREASAIDGYALTGRESLRDRYRAAHADHERAWAALEPLVRRIDGRAAVELDQLRQRSATWHEHQRALLERRVAPEDTDEWLRVDEALSAGTFRQAARVDAAIVRERDRRLDAYGEADRDELVGSIILAALALAAVLAVARLGWQLRALARETERRRREAEHGRAAEASARRELAALLESTGEGIYGLDREERVTFMNRAGAALLGYAPNELIGRPFHALAHHTHPDGTPFPKSECPILRAIREGRTVEVDEDVFWHRDGTSFAVEYSAAPIMEAGAAKGGVVAFSDITERKRTDAQLRASREQQRFLAEAGRVLAGSLEVDVTLERVAELAVHGLADFCLVDLVEEDGRIRRLAAAARDPAHQELADELRRFPPLPEQRAGVAAVLRSRKPEIVPEVTADRVDALTRSEAHRRIIHEMRPRSVLAVPLIARGRVMGVLSLLSAESGRRYGPADLAPAEALATRAALAIDNARLYQESTRATRLRDEVLAVVSHDLRNPLHTILLSAGLLLDRVRPDEEGSRQRKQLEIIQRAVGRADRLIRDLLDVARMEVGRLAVEPRPVDVAALVTETVEHHRALAEKKSIRLDVLLEPGAGAIAADPDRVHRVFDNLLGNALRFTPAGGRVVVAAAAAGDRVRFSVSDTGAGIPPADLPHVFDAFWQARAGRRQGAGLGLPIARGIVTAHGGRIWVESRVGVGTTFFFTIPRADAVAEREAA